MNNYTVLRANNEPRQFPNHKQAFEYCSALPDKTKGVYRIIDANTLGALNVSGTNENVYAMQQNSNFNFKVI
jgi:hypothetical protein